MTTKNAESTRAAVQRITLGGKKTTPVVEDQPETAPVIEAKPEAEEKERLKDSFDRQTYWLRKEYIAKIQDYAYTERLSIRKAINKIIGIAFEQIDKEYAEANKQYLHDEERDKL